MFRYTLSLFVVALAAASFAAPVPKEFRASDKFVVVETSLGSFEIELAPDKAPKTVANFLAYVDAKFYDGVVFHRVIPEFMIQGGGFVAGMKQKKARDPIENEASNGLSNLRGTVALARAVKPDSGTCQFFINTKDNKQLDFQDRAGGEGYCVFGKVVAGMDVVDKIRQVKTGMASGHSDVPVEDVVIKSVRRKQ